MALLKYSVISLYHLPYATKASLCFAQAHRKDLGNTSLLHRYTIHTVTCFHRTLSVGNKDKL